MYVALNKEFNFDYDPCPSNPKFDGLSCSWKASNFINPPHKTQKLWIEKAYEESQLDKVCVLLLPSRTDTKVFHEMILPNATEIRFIKGRLHYDEHKNSALFPSMIVIFNKNKKEIGKIIGYDYR